MRFAVDIPNFGGFGDPRAVADLARRVEEAGWDGLSLWDHIYVWKGNTVSDPWVALAAAAMATERITLMTMVTPLPRRRPWKLARETVSLDRLSGGRFVLGVGIGTPPGPEFAVFGEVTGAVARGEMLDEGLEILLGLWSGEEFRFKGAHYTVKKVQFLPTPVQQPRIPIWVAGVWPNRKPFRRAARFDGVAPIVADEESESGYRDLTPQDLTEILAYVAQHREEEGPFDVAVPGMLPADPAAAADLVAGFNAAGATWWREGWNPWGGEPYEDWEARILAGPPR